MPPNDDDALLTPDQLAALHNQDGLAKILNDEVSTKTLEKWRVRGEGPRFIRAGRKVLYRRADIEQWLASRTVSHTHAETVPVRTRAKRRR
jgi:Helix-turn-helix domain